MEAYLKDAREAVEALEAQTEEESSRQMQAAQQRARRERQERLESALKEYDKLEAAKSRVKRVSTTDPDARVMKQAEGGSAPSYNVQVSTDAAHGLIVDIDATQAGSDYQQLTPAIQRLEQSMHRAPEQMVVDGGYISSNNITEMAKRDIDFVGPQSENKAAEANRRKSYKHHGVSPEYEASKFVFDTETNTYVCPQGKHLRYDWIERGPACATRDGADLLRVPAEIQPTHELPDRTRWVILWDQSLHVHRPQQQLRAIDHLQPSLCRAFSLIAVITIVPFSRTRKAGKRRLVITHVYPAFSLASPLASDAQSGCFDPPPPTPAPRPAPSLAPALKATGKSHSTDGCRWLA